VQFKTDGSIKGGVCKIFEGENTNVSGPIGDTGISADAQADHARVKAYVNVQFTSRQEVDANDEFIGGKAEDETAANLDAQNPNAAIPPQHVGPA
jgi:hypothetical protein